MKNIKALAPWGIRLIISFMFFLSALAKLYPKPDLGITSFEYNQIEALGISDSLSVYLSRILIGIEFAIGFLILLPFHLKRVVIPGTMLMLLIFNGELIYEMLTSGNSGNCGCFGSLIEMTPLEAMVKNFIAIGLLILFYFVSTKEELKEERTVLKGYFQTSMLFNVALAAVLFMFMFVPIKAKLKTENGNNVVYVDETDSDLQEADSINKPSDTSSLVESSNKKEENIGPKPMKSGFENVFSDINDGKKILCFFAPGCDHCREAAKSLVALNKTMKDFPKIRIIFMDEEAELIPDFFKFAGKEKGYTHTVMDIKQFWGTLGKSKDVPGVVYLWNGNVQAFYQGIDKEQFDAAALKKVLNKSK